MLRILIFIRVRKEARAFLAAMRTFKHDGKENEALSFPLFFMVGVIEMCGLLMIALHAKATFARPAAREREARGCPCSQWRRMGANIQICKLKTKPWVSDLQGVNVETSHSTDNTFVTLIPAFSAFLRCTSLLQ